MSGKSDEPGRAHEEAVLRFVERFALLFADSGLPRMPARVMAYVLTADADAHTAMDLARGLRVSPAAISGAVRLLVDVRLLVKERVPGGRVDQYRLHYDDIWATLVGRQLPVFDRYEEVFTEGLGSLARDRRGARRIRETREFFRFYRAELLEMNERWTARSRAVTSERRPAPATPPG